MEKYRSKRFAMQLSCLYFQKQSRNSATRWNTLLRIMDLLYAAATNELYVQLENNLGFLSRIYYMGHYSICMDLHTVLVYERANVVMLVQHINPEARAYWRTVCELCLCQRPYIYTYRTLNRLRLRLIWLQCTINASEKSAVLVSLKYG
jgi:hypothetical protein